MYITSSITALTSPYLDKYDTGLGNVLFQVSSVYGISKSLDISCDFPAVELLTDKLKSLYNLDHYKKIYRNVPITNNNDIVYSDRINESDQNIQCNETKLVDYIREVSKNKNIIIDGYLGNTWYFNKYRDDILSMFAPDQESLDYINNKYFKNMEHYTIVSIHYRGKGFSNQPLKDYYKNAYEYVLKNIDNPFFYIFTDDISSIDLSIYDKTKYKIIENEVDYIDLWTMSMCKHNIISFSTLAWWAAYLNKNHDKIIICNNYDQFIGVFNVNYLIETVTLFI